MSQDSHDVCCYVREKALYPVSANTERRDMGMHEVLFPDSITALGLRCMPLV